MPCLLTEAFPKYLRRGDNAKVTTYYRHLLRYSSQNVKWMCLLLFIERNDSRPFKHRYPESGVLQ